MKNKYILFHNNKVMERKNCHQTKNKETRQFLWRITFFKSDAQVHLMKCHVINMQQFYLFNFFDGVATMFFIIGITVAAEHLHFADCRLFTFFFFFPPDNNAIVSDDLPG